MLLFLLVWNIFAEMRAVVLQALQARSKFQAIQKFGAPSNTCIDATLTGTIPPSLAYDRTVLWYRCDLSLCLIAKVSPLWPLLSCAVDHSVTNRLSWATDTLSISPEICWSHKPLLALLARHRALDSKPPSPGEDQYSATITSQAVHTHTTSIWFDSFPPSERAHILCLFLAGLPLITC